LLTNLADREISIESGLELLGAKFDINNVSFSYNYANFTYFYFKGHQNSKSVKLRSPTFNRIDIVLGTSVSLYGIDIYSSKILLKLEGFEFTTNLTISKTDNDA